MLPPGCIILDNKPFFYYDHIKANYHSPMNSTHFHNFYEVYYLHSGSCEYLINAKMYAIMPSTILMIPPGDVHKTNYHSAQYERILLSFTETVFHPYLKEYLCHPLFCSINENDNIVDIFQKISKAADYKSVRNQILITGYLNELLIYMVEHHREIENTNIRIPASVNSALTYISDHISSDITLKDMAAQFGYSTDYFSKLFKESTGSTFKEFLLLTRFKNAEKLLLTTNKSVTEIAYSCGFKDSNYFSYMFSKRYGVSPLKYKNIKNH